MTRVNATYEGDDVLRLDSPLPLPPNARVTVTIDEPLPEKTGEPGSSFRFARTLKLDGPPDWSERFDEYLHGNPGSGNGAS